MFRDPSVNLYVRDVESSARFYEALFGFRETFRTPKTGAAIHVELRLQSFVLGLAAADAARQMHGVVKGEGPSGEVCLWTDDVDAAWSRALESGATPLSQPHDFLDGALRAGWVCDPDGNPIQLVQRNPTHPA